MIKGKKKKIDDLQIVEDNSDVFKIRLSVTIGSRLIESDLDEALCIPTVDKLNPTIIANMMAEIPSLHARWNYLYNEAVYEYDMAKTKVEVWLAKRGYEIRKELSKTESGRVTDKMVEESIKMDTDYTDMIDSLSLAKKNMKHIFAQANGFGAKGDKIVSIASMMRLEWDSVRNVDRTGGRNYNNNNNHKQGSNYEKCDPDVNDGWPA